MRGHRGETIVATIILDTLDNRSFDQLGRRSRFVLPVKDVMEALFLDDSFKQLIHSQPSRATSGFSGDFAETFKDAIMYVKHFLNRYWISGSCAERSLCGTRYAVPASFAPPRGDV